ncbi:MAG: lipopolysaccharide transport periplasmic protein LptA, partial [Gammaproteobacteria bacterium]
MHFRLLLMLLLALPAPLSFALPSDASQPIKIESDRAERNDKKGTTVYEGSVVIRQGTIKIRADKVIVYTERNQVDRIVCIGKPAHYQQQP